MKRNPRDAWHTWRVVVLTLVLACVPLVARIIWAAMPSGMPLGAPVQYTAPDVGMAPNFAANKLRLSDPANPSGTTGPVLCAMDMGETPPTEVLGCDIMLIRHTADCSTPGTNDLWCRWNGTTYIPAGGDVATFARVDGEGELINPEEVTGSFLLRGAGPPAAGSCPHGRATYSDTATLGDTYVCYGAGQNWHLIGEHDDNFVELTLDDQSPIIASGPTFGTLRSRLRVHATDCTALTDGVSGQACWEQDSNRIFVCEPTAGGCDTAAEWVTPVVATTSTSLLSFATLGTQACTNPGPTESYLGLGAHIISTNPGNRQARVAKAFTATAIAMTTQLAIPAGQTVVISLNEDAADTTVTCTAAAGASTCQATGFGEAVAVNSNIQVKVACSGGTTALGSMFVTVAIQ